MRRRRASTTCWEICEGISTRCCTSAATSQCPRGWSQCRLCACQYDTQIVCDRGHTVSSNVIDTLIGQIPEMLPNSCIDVEFEDDHEWDTQGLVQSSVMKRAASDCRLTADARWTQSSHQKGLPPSQRDAKRIATATTGIMPVTYAVILMRFVYESCGRLQRSACARSISAGGQ